jgi:hypothetical protein
MEPRGVGKTPVALERPSDVAWLDFGSTSGARPADESWSEPAWHQAGLLAVAEYFGGVHLYAHPGPLHSKRTMTPDAGGTGSCAPATPPLRMLDYVLCLRPSRNGRRAFERPSALGVDRIVLTKLDEAASFGTLVSLVERLGKSVSFFTHGQEVPDHIEIARSRRLAALVLGSEVR